MEEEERMKLERTIEELESYRGRHTELVTVYIPAGYSILLTAKQIDQEVGTASNIKSKSTRKNVIEALERISRHLRLFKKTPKNGLALFCGNISRIEGQPNIKIWSMEPPLPINMKTYRCDQKFVLDPLKELLNVSEVYGLVVMDRREATLGVLKGKHIKRLKHMTSNVPGKIKAGGQCQDPETIIELADGSHCKIKDLHNPLSLVSRDFSNNSFCPSKLIDRWSIRKKGLEITTKDTSTIASDDHLFFIKDEGVKEKVASELKVGDDLLFKSGKELTTTEIIRIEKLPGEREMIDISVENKNFIANGLVVHNSAQRFERITEGMALEFYRRIGTAMKAQFFEMPKLKGILVGGPGPTKESFIAEGQIATALKRKIMAVKDISYTDEFGLHVLVEASEDILSAQEIIKEKELMKIFFTTLAKDQDKIAYGEAEVKKALESGAVEKLYLSKALKRDKSDEFRKLAADTGAKICFISVETEEGAQFKNLGGIGGLLRFALF